MMHKQSREGGLNQLQIFASAAELLNGFAASFRQSMCNAHVIICC